MSGIFLCAMRNIIRKKTRSILTSLGVAVGIISIVLIGNISQCGIKTVGDELDSIGLGGMTISANAKINNVEKKQLSNEHLELVKKSEYVDEAMELITRTAEASSRNLKTNSLVFGIGENAGKIISLKTIYGRTINKKDISNKNNVCIVDQKLCQKFYSRDNILGKKISILAGDVYEDFEVIGVAKTGRGLLENVFGSCMPDIIYVPHSSIQSQTRTGKFDQIAVKIKKNQKLSTEEIGKKIAENLTLNCQENREYISNDLSKQISGLIKVLDTITVILSVIGSISLLVSSLSIMVVMLVSVGERTKEIGIKKAIGASSLLIMLEFLMEAVIITLLVSLTGIILGNIIFFIGSKLFSFPLVINFNIIALGLLFSLITGLVFGIYPAYKASKMKPVDALRTF